MPALTPRKILLLASVLLGSHATPSFAAQEPIERPYSLTEQREPCTHYTATKQPFFGDTHVHTAYSFDANAQDTRNTPADAYRFAQGEPMGIQPYTESGDPTRTIQLDRPLDFTAVTDHSEFLGEIEICTTPGTEGYWHPACMIQRYMPQYADMTMAAYGLVMKSRWGLCGENDQNCRNKAMSVWQRVQDAAEQSYDRSADCRFTSFVGYEFTATVGAGKNLHRNVIFKNDSVPDYAQSWVDTDSAEDLWTGLQDHCVDKKQGCDALTIPHNSNLSGGYMFNSAAISGDEIPEIKLTAEAAARRARWEPLVEIVQHKGSSECDNRIGWTEDEFCGFEKLAYDTFGNKNTGRAQSNDGIIAQVSSMIGIEQRPVRLPDPNNYVRWALKEGLKQQQELGVNGFKFGITAATDTHIAAPGQTSEKGHPGHGGAGMGAREGVKGLPDELEFGPGGLTVLWAEENTRDSLFAAMQRKEAYATSGTRPILRFFGGWDYSSSLCGDPDMLEKAYQQGVPMGGDLTTAQAGQKPQFLVSAMQDIGTTASPGTPLQRVQIIKGWYEDGELKEEVLDVAGGDNSASVDLNTCQRQGSGHKQLCTVWQDNHFNPEAAAFYYVRALENPSCRWSQYTCLQAKVSCDDPSTITPGLEGCCSPDHQPTIQERAWSSPIWYTP